MRMLNGMEEEWVFVFYAPAMFFQSTSRGSVQEMWGKPEYPEETNDIQQYWQTPHTRTCPEWNLNQVARGAVIHKLMHHQTKLPQRFLVWNDHVEWSNGKNAFSSLYSTFTTINKFNALQTKKISTWHAFTTYLDYLQIKHGILSLFHWLFLLKL